MKIDKRHLPLNALRAFEAAGRHLHMRHAAEEMCVSQSAVSQQVRKLEDLLDVQLFERTNKGLQLTPSGSRLLDNISTTLDNLVQATANITPESYAAELRIACAPGVACNWLLPNLDDFLLEYDAFDIRIDTIPVYPTEIPTDVDLAIAYGKPPVSEDRVSQLPGSQLLPVCSPELLDGSDRSRSLLDQLSRYPLIHADSGNEWQQWLRAAGADGLRNSRNLYLSIGYHTILEGVRRGLGIGLIAKRFIEKDIESGQLVVLSSESTFEPEHYFIVRPAETVRSHAGRLFERWLLSRWN